MFLLPYKINLYFCIQNYILKIYHFYYKAKSNFDSFKEGKNTKSNK